MMNTHTNLTPSHSHVLTHLGCCLAVAVVGVLSQTRVNASYGVPGWDGSGGILQWEERGGVASHGNDVAKLCDGSLGERVWIDALALAQLQTTVDLNTTVK